MLLVLSLASALAADPAPPPIVGGSTTSEYAAVGALVARSGDLAGSFCSGTLIAADRVLTAAHCVEGAIAYYEEGYDLEFATGTRVDGGLDSRTPILSGTIHGDYQSSPILEHDIAVLTLSEAPGIAPIPYAEGSPLSGEWDTDTLEHVGWGATADDGSGAGVKRKVSLDFEGADPQFLYSQGSGGSNVCSGDSGGAALSVDDDGDTVLVGVNAFVFDPEGGSPVCEGGAAGSTRIDTNLAFIEAALDAEPEAEEGTSVFATADSYTSGNGSLPGDEKGGCSAIPIDSGEAPSPLWAIGLACLAVGIRRRNG